MIERSIATPHMRCIETTRHIRFLDPRKRVYTELMARSRLTLYKNGKNRLQIGKFVVKLW